MSQYASIGSIRQFYRILTNRSGLSLFLLLRDPANSVACVSTVQKAEYSTGKSAIVRLGDGMDNGVEPRGGGNHGASTNAGQPKPDIFHTIVADSEKAEKRTLRDLSLEWITDLKSGAETAYGVGGFRYRIYTTEEFGTCCMYMWPGHSITTYYESHEEGKLAMNDHYEALCQIREECTRELIKDNEALKKRLQTLLLRTQD